jgi:dienelactone hydrolase
MRIEIDEKPTHYSPASEAEVRSWITKYYDYDKVLPRERWKVIEETDEWRCERIEYNGAEGQRAIAYLYLPKGVAVPHQVIHLLPAGDVTFGFRTVPQSIEADYASVIRSGRAVFAVVLGHYKERGVFRPLPDPQSVEYVEWFARNVAEMRRGLDYLLLRRDIDASRVAFMGVSFGGGFTALPAMESRYRAAIISGANLEDRAVRPEAFSVNFIPLIRVPTLLFHGRYDEASPLATVAEPIFNLLPKQTRFKHTHPGTHRADPEVHGRAISEWLDRIFGEVKQSPASD